MDSSNPPLLYSDRPISSNEEFAAYGRTMRDLLLTLARYGEGANIGVYGNWGSGKSTLLHIIANSLMAQQRSTDKPLVVVFDAWKYTIGEEVWNALVRRLLNAIKEESTFPEWLRLYLKILWERLQKPLRYLWRAIDRSTSKEPPTGLLDEASTVIRDFSQKRPIVVLIDDLDRLPLEQIVPTLEAIKLLTTFGEEDKPARISSVVAADRQVLHYAIARQYRFLHPEASEVLADHFAYEYLDKLIQIPFELPPLSRPLEEINLLPTEKKPTRIASLYRTVVGLIVTVPLAMSVYVLTGTVLKLYLPPLFQYVVPITIVLSILVSVFVITATANGGFLKQTHERESDIRALRIAEKDFFQSVEVYLSGFLSEEVR